MMDELKDDKVIKLMIEEGLNPRGYFKDGPEPEPLLMYNNELTKEPIENENLEGYKFTVPKCLESLFRDNKIIPSNIPSFLKDAIKLNYQNLQDVKMDIDIPLLFDLLHNKALELLKTLEKVDIQKGRDYLYALVQLKPDNYIALYNLACAESLMNRVPEALSALEAAIKNGYRNMEHLLCDTDFDNIRDTDGFVNLIGLIEELGSNFVDKEVFEECNDCECEEKETCNDGKCENYTNNDSQLSNEPVVLEYDSSQYDDEIKDLNFSMNDSNIPEPNTQSINNNLSESFVDLRKKWTVQIANIKSLGFAVDDEVLSLLLEQTEGKVEDVVNLLLQSSKPM